ncbi:MAG: hypothetical protein SFU56_01080 [Capsulimonadales bacterium]|nr:hypothetical protein [Capsulimonadales bacterium]
MFDIGILPEDFPALGLSEGDMLCYQPVRQGQSLPEHQALIVRNIHNGKLTVGYLEGTTLHLPTRSIRHYHDWGAEVTAIVTGRQRRFPAPKY